MHSSEPARDLSAHSQFNMKGSIDLLAVSSRHVNRVGAFTQRSRPWAILGFCALGPAVQTVTRFSGVREDDCNPQVGFVFIHGVLETHHICIPWSKLLGHMAVLETTNKWLGWHLEERIERWVGERVARAFSEGEVQLRRNKEQVIPVLRICSLVVNPGWDATRSGMIEK